MNIILLSDRYFGMPIFHIVTKPIFRYAILKSRMLYVFSVYCINIRHIRLIWYENPIYIVLFVYRYSGVCDMPKIKHIPYLYSKSIAKYRGKQNCIPLSYQNLPVRYHTILKFTVRQNFGI